METKEKIKLLIAALRSGKYKQAQARLKNTDSCFCFEGLALEIARKNWLEGSKWKSFLNEQYTFKYKWKNKWIAIGGWLKAQDWINIYGFTPKVNFNDNDRGYTFEIISNILEEQLSEL